MSQAIDQHVLNCRVRGNYNLAHSKGANTVISSGYTTHAAAAKLLAELTLTGLFENLRVQRFASTKVTWEDVEELKL